MIHVTDAADEQTADDVPTAELHRRLTGVRRVTVRGVQALHKLDVRRADARQRSPADGNDAVKPA